MEIYLIFGFIFIVMLLIMFLSSRYTENNDNNQNSNDEILTNNDDETDNYEDSNIKQINQLVLDLIEKENKEINEYSELNEDSKKIVLKTIEILHNTNESLLKPSVKFGENIISSLKSSIKTNISKKYLQSTSWILIKKDTHTFFTFLENDRLLITESGKITEGKYELIIQSKSIILSRNNEAEHFFFLNIYDNYFFINKISTDEVIVFVNHDYYEDNKRDDFLNKATILKNIILKK